MKFSQVDVIGKANELLANRKDAAHMKVIGQLFNAIMYPKNPRYTFNFYVPQYLFIRSISFCEDVEAETDKPFDPGELARVLYEDFLEYATRSNNINDIYTRLNARGRSPAAIRPYSIDESHPGVVFEEIRGFEGVKTKIHHKRALKGEFILHDMLEIYPDHKFKLEDILGIVYCDFMDDYRKGLIKNPIAKIAQYII